MSRPDYASQPAGGPRAAHLLGSRLFCGVSVVLLSCLGAIVYAQQAAAEVAYRLIVEGGIVLLWLASAAGWGAGPTRWLLKLKHHDGRQTSATLVVVTSIAIGLGILSLALLALGLAGFLSMVSGFLLLMAGLPWLVVLRGARQTPRQIPSSDSRWHWLWLAVVPTLSLALAAVYVPPGLLWKPQEPHGYDVVEYHFQIPREWFELGRIVPLEHNVFSYFPFGVEMHYLLAMHLRGGAWEGMYLAQLMHLAMIALAAIAVAAFASRFARSHIVATIAAVVGATTPWLMQLGPIGFNEGGLLLYGTLAVGWVAMTLAPSPGTPAEGSDEGRREDPDRRKDPDPPATAITDRLRSLSGPHPNPLPANRERAPDLRIFALAGLCAGFACGAKLTAVPLLLLAVPLVAGLLMLRQSPRRALIAAAVFVAVGLLAFSPWLIRNVIWSGNPIFPEGRALFGNDLFNDVQATRWHQAHAAQPAQQSVGGRLTALVDQVMINWQFGWILLPLTIAALVTSWRRPIARLLAGLLVIQTLFWLGFTHLQGRFFVLAIPMGVLAIAGAPWDALRASAIDPSPRRRNRIGVAAITAIVLAIAVMNWWQVHRRLAYKLYAEHGTGMSVALGNTDIAWITFESIQGFPLNDPSSRLLLVGDAQAFWYPLPGTRLYYRTIFDLQTGNEKPLIDAFDPHGWRHDGKTWLLVTPTELDRYENTYQPFPPIPVHWRRAPAWAAGLPFLVPPAEVARWVEGR